MLIISVKYQLDPTSGPKDMFGRSPNVLNVGPALFAQPRPSQVISQLLYRIELTNIGIYNRSQ